MRTQNSRLLATGLAGVFGCLIGAFLEKQRITISDCVAVKASSVLPRVEEYAPFYNPDKETTGSVLRVQQIMKYGYPTLDGLRSFPNFMLSYNQRTRIANWVIEHVTPEMLKNKDLTISRKNSVFFEDDYIHPYFRSTNLDYRGSGYDKGHLAPAADHLNNEKTLNQTFILSNIAPQVGEGFNRGIWSKLERYTRYRAKYSENVWICTGPLFIPQKNTDGKKYIIYEVIGNNQVAVPTHFFKVLLIETSKGEFEMEAYLIANRPMDNSLPLLPFQVNIDVIERSAGFLLFSKFSRENLKAINGPNKVLERYEKMPWANPKPPQIKGKL